MEATGYQILFVAIAVPTIALLLVWGVLTAWRILWPERPLPFLRDPAGERRRRTASGEALPVGFREIREDIADGASGAWVPRAEARGGPAGDRSPAPPAREDERLRSQRN